MWCGNKLLFDRAADWKLDEPDWTGRLRVVSKGNDLVLKLEDANTGNLASLYNTQLPSVNAAGNGFSCVCFSCLCSEY